MPAQILMCPPEFYGIEYEINAWMSRARQADRDLAVRQWEGLKELLGSVGQRFCCSNRDPACRISFSRHAGVASIIRE